MFGTYPRHNAKRSLPVESVGNRCICCMHDDRLRKSLARAMCRWYVFQMIPRAMPDMYMRAYPLLCRAILGVLYMCLFFWPSGTQSTSLFESFGLNPRVTIAFQIPKAHEASPCGGPSSRRCTISRDSTLLRLWNEVFWGTRFIPAIGVLLASKHRGQVILVREDF